MKYNIKIQKKVQINKIIEVVGSRSEFGWGAKTSDAPTDTSSSMFNGSPAPTPRLVALCATGTDADWTIVGLAEVEAFSKAG